jgi:hypothetical protein
MMAFMILAKKIHRGRIKKGTYDSNVTQEMS